LAFSAFELDGQRRRPDTARHDGPTAVWSRSEPIPSPYLVLFSRDNYSLLLVLSIAVLRVICVDMANSLHSLLHPQYSFLSRAFLLAMHLFSNQKRNCRRLSRI
jgi:hypothetical protein